MRSSTIKILSAGLVLAAVAFFPADGLRALGLGEARVDSYLGQPLTVSIRLVEPESDAVDTLSVAAASPEDYDRLGVPPTALSLGLEVAIDRSVEPPQIRVRSRREVTDPVVQILIDARWSSGRVLREYTLFLDPPTLPVAPPIRRVESEAEAAVPPAASVEPPVESAPDSEPAETEERRAPPRAVEPAPEAPELDDPGMDAEPAMPAADEAPTEAVSAPRPSQRDRTVGPIAPGQTLWSIASAWRPSTGLTMNQVMLAILDQNPQAFIDGNVNQLQRGAILDMPSTDAIASIDPSEADRRMQAQMMGWQPMVEEPEVPVISDDAVPEVMDESDPAPVEEVDDTSYRLEVVPPEGEAIDDVPAVSESEIGDASRRLSELEDQLFIEGLDDDELYSEVEEIRDAIEARDMAGLAVANEGLANLEARLREAREEREQAEELAAQEEAAVDAREEEPVDGAADEVDEYFRDLEDELSLDEEDSRDAADEGDVMAEDPAMVEQDEMESVVDDGDADAPAFETLDEIEEEPARPVTQVSPERDSGMPFWLFGLIAAAIALVVAAGLFLRKKVSRGPRDSARIESTLSVEELRARVIEEPDNLDAHLALLNSLADRDEEAQFSDALDAMYARVGDDDDPRWQAALNLAVLNAPDHPLLTPPEDSGGEAADSMDGLDDRTREMLGILETPEDESEGQASADDLAFDTLSDDEDEGADATLFDKEDDVDEKDRRADDPASKDADETGEFDLSTLSDSDGDDFGPNFGDDSSARDEASSSDDTLALDDDEALLADSEAEDPALEGSADDELDLDFEFSSDEDAQKEGDALSLDDIDLGSDDDDEKREDPDTSDTDVDFGPADTLDLSSESASNGTVRLDPDELTALGDDADDDETESPSDDGGTVRADDTLDLVSNSDLDFEDVGDSELEAFLSEGDESLEDDDEDLISESDAASSADNEPSSEKSESEDDSDDGDEDEPALSDDDADVKLDLAQAYLSMDDSDSARTLLEEIVAGGSKAKRARAQELLGGL